MRAQDIIRAVLDVLDQKEQVKDDLPPDDEEKESRFKQILAMLDNPKDGPLANSPNEIVAPLDSVTDVGGGPNKPKHPHDIRVKDPSAYPDQQEY